MRPHTPIQYIIGKTRFRGIDIDVDERVLIPRPETELLVETVAGIASREGRRLRILDLCTGSGNIAISLTKEIPECKIVASDISEDALEVARHNAGRNGAAGRIEFVLSDLFTDVEGRFDIIASNPPYIARPEFDTLQQEVLEEPRIALDGGEDGLDFYRNIISGSEFHLNDGGYLVMEAGYGQMRRVCGMMEEGSFSIVSVTKDFNGIERVIAGRWIN